MTDKNNATPDPRYIIAALQEELSAANDNRLFLIAVLKQMQAEFQEAQEMWNLERESLMKKVSEQVAPGESE